MARRGSQQKAQPRRRQKVAGHGSSRPVEMPRNGGQADQSDVPDEAVTDADDIVAGADAADQAEPDDQDEKPADEPADRPAAVPTRRRSRAGLKPARPDADGEVGSRRAVRAAATEVAERPAKRARQAMVADESDDEPDDTVDDGSSRPRTGLALLIVLLVTALAFGALAAYFRGQADRASTGAADNRAVIDTEATSEVVGQVSSAIETVLSYDYTKLDENERAASEVITGKYADEFELTFADVRENAPDQKVVLNTTVLLAGVVLLTGHTDGARAELIATMDLAAEQDGEPVSQPGRARVVAERVDGHWKIAQMTLL